MVNTPLDWFKELQKHRQEYSRQTAEECEATRLAYVNEQFNIIRAEIYRLKDTKYEEPQA